MTERMSGSGLARDCPVSLTVKLVHLVVTKMQSLHLATACSYCVQSLCSVTATHLTAIANYPILTGPFC